MGETQRGLSSRGGFGRVNSFLVKNDTGDTVPVIILENLTTTIIEETENDWLPPLISALQARLQSGVRGSSLPEHIHWLWSRKARQYSGKSGYQFVGLEAEGAMRGMMLVNTIYRCRLPVQQGAMLVYVDYLSTAPWNLKALTDTPTYRGVGRILIETAIRISRDNAMAGRIGLHALPQAESFYRDTCGMTDLGEDPTEYDLRYFEMTEARASAFMP